MSNIKNTGILRTTLAEVESRQCKVLYTVTLSTTPDVNPYAGGVAPTTAPVFYFVKHDNRTIQCQWATITGTAGASTKLTWNQKVPAECRPKTDYYVSVPLINGGTSATGLLKLGSNGSITYSTAADGAFTNSGTCEIRGSSITYGRC